VKRLLRAGLLALVLSLSSSEAAEGPVVSLVFKRHLELGPTSVAVYRDEDGCWARQVVQVGEEVLRSLSIAPGQWQSQQQTRPLETRKYLELLQLALRASREDGVRRSGTSPGLEVCIKSARRSVHFRLGQSSQHEKLASLASPLFDPDFERRVMRDLLQLVREE